MERTRNRTGDSLPVPVPDSITGVDDAGSESSGSAPRENPRTRSYEQGELPPALAKLAKDSEKQYGSRVVTTGNMQLPINRTGTGVFSLDVALYGGWAERFMHLIYGTFDGGKTTMIAKAIAQFQRKYPALHAVYIDTEGHYDADWFAINGVDVTRLVVISDLEIGEQYVDVFHDVLLSGEVSMVAIDSIASIIPGDTVKKSAEDNEKMAARAKIVGRLCSSFTTCKHKNSADGKHVPTALWVNQVRASMAMYGDQSVLPGGAFQNYLAHTKLLVKKPKITEGKDSMTGVEMPFMKTYEWHLQKAKGGLFFEKGSYNLVTHNDHSPFYYESNVDDIATVMTYANQLGALGGGGKKQTFVMFPDEYFQPQDGKKAVEMMAQALLADQYKYDLFKASIVGMARLNKGLQLMPPDNYLCGHTSDEIVPVVKAIVANRKKKLEGVA